MKNEQKTKDLEQKSQETEQTTVKTEQPKAPQNTCGTCVFFAGNICGYQNTNVGCSDVHESCKFYERRK